MKRLFALSVLLLTLAAAAFADTVPSTMTFQGRLAKPDGTPVADSTTQQLTFRLFANPSGGNALWTQTSNTVSVHNGIFSVALNFATGYASGQNQTSVFANPPYLEVQVGANPPLSPRQLYNSVAYAFVANSALSVPDGSITSNKLANNAVTNAKIANGAVGLSKLDSSLQQTLSPVNGWTQTVGLGLVGSIAAGTYPVSVAISGNYAYVANRNSDTLQIFNISKPESPMRLGTIGTNYTPLAVAVSGHYAYVINYGANTFQVFNVSDPAFPTLVSTLPTGPSPNSLQISGNYAYVTNSFGDSLQIFNISTPNSPRQACVVGTGRAPFSVAISGHYAYVINEYDSTLQVFNVSNPNSPTLVSTVPTDQAPYCLVVSGNYAYVTSVDTDTLQIFNISTPSSPTRAGSIGTDRYPISVAVSGSYAYVVDHYSNNLQVFNVSDPNNPTLADGIGTGHIPGDVTVSGNYVYLAGGDSNTLQIFHTPTLQVPSNLKVLGSLTATSNIAIGTINPTGVLHLKGDLPGAEVKFGGAGGDVHHLSSARDFVFNSAIGEFRFRKTYNFNDLSFFNNLFTILGDGNATLAGTLTQNSDARYKTNVHAIENPLDAILNLRGVTYDWDTERWKGRTFPEGRQIGLIAQEVEKVLPELVHTDKEGYKSVAYQNLVPVLVEATKSQQKQIETLKAENADLQSRLSALEAAFRHIQQKPR